MKLSGPGAEVLCLREGIRLVAYKDTKGIWTVGVGDIDMNNDGILDVKPDTHITREQALANFAKDVTWAEDAVNKYVTKPLTQNQFDALVSFVFNVGETQFKRSTLVKKLNVGDYEGAAREFDRWHVPIEITSRRNSERDQFKS